MTFKDLCTKHLADNGMFDDGAASVVESFMEDKSQEAMTNRWNESTDNYPDAMKAVIVMSCRFHALKWIDKHEPQAWYRECFNDAAQIAKHPKPRTEEAGGRRQDDGQAMSQGE